MKVVIYVFVCFIFLEAKELFLPKHIYIYMHVKNPFYYQAIGEQFIAKEKEKFFEGSLDTQLKASYDNKNYPTTDGIYENVELWKPTENGIEFSLGYRRAEGVQEYNNIQTGQEGEIISSIKIPLFSVINDISKNKVDIQNAKLTTEQLEFEGKFNLLKLHFNITKIYYQLLLQRQISQTYKELLDKAKKTKKFISKRIEQGQIAEIAGIEVQKLIINREQQYLEAMNEFTLVKNIFLQYLGITETTFDKKYKIPLIKMKNKSLPTLKRAIGLAIEKRPDLKMIDTEMAKLSVRQEYNEFQKYPQLDMQFSGTYDPIFKEGYKVSFNFNFPLEQRRYSGMHESLQKENLMLQSKKIKSIREIETNIMNLYQKIKIKKQTISLSKQELSLAKRLEDVEVKKIYEGVSNLIFLNQREMGTLIAQQKVLRSYYDLKVYILEVDYFLGTL